MHDDRAQPPPWEGRPSLLELWDPLSSKNPTTRLALEHKMDMDWDRETQRASIDRHAGDAFQDHSSIERGTGSGQIGSWIPLLNLLLYRFLFIYHSIVMSALPLLVV